MRVYSKRMSRRVAVLLAMACGSTVLAQSHPTGVPVLSSKPGAAYTIYLDFAGFDFTGTWGAGGATPGDGGAYEGATTSFSASEQSDIEQTWAHIAEKYSVFNVNVTTLDPAIAAGQAGSDFSRQAYYDATARMMHTVIGSEDGWNDNGGVSYVGVTKNAESTTGNGGASYGYHTNFTFTNGVGTSPQIVGEDASHENGHGFGLEHQSDWSGTTKTEEYSSNNNSEGNGSFAPTMGDSYYSQRGLWRDGLDDQGTGTTIQNDVQVIAGNSGMGAYTDDGIGNTMSAASLLPIYGTTIDDRFARGIITPTSTSAPTANLSSGYTSDYFKFNSSGAAISLTVHNGAERVAYGSTDSGVTLKSILSIQNSTGAIVSSTEEAASSTQTETYSGTLPAGTYYAIVSSAADTQSTITGNTSYYYDMGSFFLTGSGISNGLYTSLYFAGGASTTKWNQIDSGTTSNWRTDAGGATDAVQTPGADVDVYLSANIATGVSSTTLGASTSINSLTFTGTGTTAANSSVTIAADGSTLTILAAASNTSYRATGLTVLAGALADTIATPVVLGSSQIWAINNSASNPLLVSGIISDGGSGYGITKTGVGGLTLSAANTFSGESAMSGGTILLKNTLALQDTTLNNSGGTLVFDSSATAHAFTLGAIGGSSGLVLADNASTPDNVALTTGGDGDSTTLSGIVSGGGSLTQVGGGALTLSGANTFTGTRTISDGTINFSGNQNGSTGSIILTGDANNDAETVNIIAGGTTVAAGNSIQIGSPSSLHSVATFNSSGAITNNGSLSVARAGFLTLNSGAAWNQSGAMTVEGVGGYSASVLIGSGGAFNYNGSSAISMTDGGSGGTATINISGGTFTTSKNFNLASHGTGSDTVILAAGGTLGASANISNLFTTSVSGTPIVFLLDVGGGIINTASNTVGVSDTVTGTTLTKTGTGQLALSGTNTYSGGTNISSGAVLATNNSSLGTGTVDIFNGGSSTASLQLSGGVTITNTFAGFASEVGSGTPTIESISGSNAVTAPLSITSTGGNGAIFQSDSGSTLNLSGGLTTTLTSARAYYLQGAGTGIVSSNITDSSSNILSLTKTGTGTWTLTGTDNYAEGTTVSAGTLIFASPSALPAFSTLSISGIAIAANHGTAAKNSLFASSLTLAGAINNSTGKLDLTNNDLVVRNGSLSTLNAEVRQGYNAGGIAWQGSGGIVSSTAAADSTHLTALGVIQNSVDGTSTGTVLMNSFDGRTVYNNDVLVKYTYVGDANLDGKVDGTDYSRIDSGFLTQQTGWFNGDFNYDGVINGSDYTLIDNAFNTQGAVLTSEITGPDAVATGEIAGTSAVPEPASLGLLGIGLLGLLGRRRGGCR